MPDDSTNPREALGRSADKDNRLQDTVEGSRVGTPTDYALLQQVRDGNQQAIAAIYDRYGGIVYSGALRVLGDRQLAEDVAQEIFFQLWRNPSAFAEGRGSLGAWLMVVARNRAIDILRRRKPEDAVEDIALALPYDLSAEAERNIVMEKVRQALNDLPQEQQSALEMAFFEGLTHPEIAARTGIPLGTVKTRIRLALIGLRKALRG